MAVKRIDLAWVTVSDIERAKRFFTDTLGLELTADSTQDGWLEFDAKDGGATLGVGLYTHDNAMGVNPGNNAIITLTVEDLEAIKRTMEMRGTQFIGEIIEIPGYVKLALFTDPDGNKFQLVETLDEGEELEIEVELSE